MTDFEAATVAYQTASLAMQQAQMWSTYAQAGGALLVGGAQCPLIYLGLVTHIPLPVLLLRHKRFPLPLLGGVPRSGGVGSLSSSGRGPG